MMETRATRSEVRSQLPYICSLSRELSLDADTDTSEGMSFFLAPYILFHILTLHFRLGCSRPAFSHLFLPRSTSVLEYLSFFMRPPTNFVRFPLAPWPRKRRNLFHLFPSSDLRARVLLLPASVLVKAHGDV